MFSKVGQYFSQCSDLSDLKLRTSKHVDSGLRLIETPMNANGTKMENRMRVT